MNNLRLTNKHFNLIQGVIVKVLSTFTLILLLLSGTASAASVPTPVKTSKSKVSLNIKSDTQSFDLKTNTAIFTGNVVITRDGAVVKADKARLNKNNNGNETVDATGNPVNFTSSLTNGKIVSGSSTTLHYDVTQDKVTLTGNAFLKQDDNSIHGDIIHYSIKNEEMTASGNKSQQVSTVIIPNEVSKNNTQSKVNNGKISR